MSDTDRGGTPRPNMAMMSIFLCIFLSVFSLTHWYVYARLVRAPAWPSPWAMLAGTLLVLGAISGPIAMIGQRVLSPSRIRWLLLVGFAWLGTFFFLFVATAAVHALSKALGAFGVAGETSVQRRLLLARLAAGASAAVAATMALAARRSVAHGALVHRVPIALPRWPAAMNDYTIAHISDLHVAPLLGRDYVEQVVQRTLAARPDLIVLTGDLVDGSVAHLQHDIAPLAQLRARDGVFMVTGNHEYYSGADAWLAHLRTLGVRPLRNEHVVIGGAQGFVLAGIDDWTAHQFGGDHGADLSKALRGVADTSPIVLLAHQPRAVTQAAQHGVDLMLSGHTHGGQLWPFGWLVRLVQPYVRGLHRHNERTFVYVNPGTGYWGPPMRLGAPAEIALLRLRRQAEVA